MTSGPGTRVGAPGPTQVVNGGTTTDLGSPFTTCVISIGCIAAPIEIVPINEPASDGRPSALANCFEIRSRPSSDAKRLSRSVVIVLVSFNIKKGESVLLSRTARSKPWSEGSFSTASCLRDAA